MSVEKIEKPMEEKKGSHFIYFDPYFTNKFYHSTEEYVYDVYVVDNDAEPNDFINGKW